MPTRACSVSLTDAEGVRHTVEVIAESLFEAAAVGLAEMKQAGWVGRPAKATKLEIAVVPPVARHSITVEHVERWLDGVTTSPRDRIKKDKLKAALLR
jgi:hypothetical protein